MRFHPGQQVRAEIERASGRDELRLYIFVYDGRERSAYLGEDGLFHDYAEWDMLSDPQPGLVVPHGTKDAFIEGLLPHMDAGAEKVLRAAWERAEARVDRLIDRALDT